VSDADILHETARRLRVLAAAEADLPALLAACERLPGVASARVNPSLHCVVVQYDGRAETRAAVLEHLRRPAQAKPPRPRTPRRRPLVELANWTPGLLAIAVPALPQAWRPAAALGVVGTRVLTQAERLRQDPAAVVLDALSLASMAVSGQPLVVSASVLLRLMSERLAARLVRQADTLLGQRLPTEAETYLARREAGDGSAWSSSPLSALRAGDRVRLVAGDTVPLDGCVVDGSAVLAPAADHAGPRTVIAGEHLAAGEQLRDGRLELRAEADAASSRLARLRAQVRNAIGARDPAGRLTPGIERLLSLPLTASALVLSLTGDTARAGSMLQADPQQGLDLALPLAREAALYALTRQGLLTAGLEAIERLASAPTLVLQDTGVLASGRWHIEAVHTEPGGDAAQVRRWLAALADTPLEVLDVASVSDRVVRQWVRHGAVLCVGAHEVHLASRQRLQQVWGRRLDEPKTAPTAGAADEPLRRELAVVKAGRVIARVVLASPLRPAVLERLDELATLGFERVAVFVEADGAGAMPPLASDWRGRPGLAGLVDDAGLRADWLAAAVRDGTPLILVHTALRDLVPPGSLSLTPMDADAGSHGMLLGDPLASLVAARRLAQTVHRRLRLQQTLATAANAALMTTAAVRWLPPIGTALLHHGFALLLLLDSLRIESLDLPLQRERPPAGRAAKTARPRPAVSSGILRSEPA
jgi:cation transport ATPase